MKLKRHHESVARSEASEARAEHHGEKWSSTSHRTRSTRVNIGGFTWFSKSRTEGQRADVRNYEAPSKTFIEPSQSIVLVVCACNADLATAEALRLAAEADPDGERTVGVFDQA